MRYGSNHGFDAIQSLAEERTEGNQFRQQPRVCVHAGQSRASHKLNGRTETIQVSR